MHVRHYAMMRLQLTLSDKMPHLYSRGSGQVEDGFAMIRLARGLGEDDFRKAVYTYTVINSNSPRSSITRWRRASSTSRAMGS